MGAPRKKLVKVTKNLLINSVCLNKDASVGRDEYRIAGSLQPDLKADSLLQIVRRCIAGCLLLLFFFAAIFVQILR